MVQIWLYGISAALCASALLRVLFLLVFRVPVTARTCGSDLTEMQRGYDDDMFWRAFWTELPTRDILPYRGVTARVAYDVDGIEQRSDVCLLTFKGDRPETAPVIWYDPANPSRATGIGPGPTLLLPLLAGALAVLAWHWPF